MIRSLKTLLLLGFAVLVAACDPTADLDGPTRELGDFRVGHVAVVMPDPKTLPGSRSATEEEWKTALTQAVNDRLGRYAGGKVYHLGIAVEIYNLASIDVPGVPTPKSALALSVNLWDDAAGTKLHKEPKTITVLGIFSGAGIQPTKQVQLDNLSALAAKNIEEWLEENPQWFGLPPKAD